MHDWVFATPSGQRMIGHDPGDLEEGLDDEFFEAGISGHRRDDHGPQHVRPDTWRVGRLGLDGLVGRGPALPPPGVRAHPPPTRPDRDGGWDHLPLRHRRHRVGARSRPPTPPAPTTSASVVARSTIRQYLQAGLIDELHLAIVAGPARRGRAALRRRRQRTRRLHVRDRDARRSWPTSASPAPDRDPLKISRYLATSDVAGGREIPGTRHRPVRGRTGRRIGGVSQ